MKTSLIAALMLSVLIFTGCSSEGDAANTDMQSAKPDPSAVAAVELGGTPISLAGITFTPPTVWTDHGPSGMRKADYSFGPLGDDTDSATVAAYYFGPTGGGGIEANIDRWIGQMTLPDGADPEGAIMREESMVEGMAVHTVQLPGTYNATMGGPMMGGQTTPKEGYFMSAVVLEAPEGNVFFKLTGPKETATAMNTAFQAMLARIKKGDASM